MNGFVGCLFFLQTILPTEKNEGLKIHLRWKLTSILYLNTRPLPDQQRRNIARAPFLSKDETLKLSTWMTYRTNYRQILMVQQYGHGIWVLLFVRVERPGGDTIKRITWNT